MLNYQIVKFRENNIEIDVNVSSSEDTVWPSKDDMSILFQRDRSVITRHIANTYKEGELEEKSTRAKNAHDTSFKRQREYEKYLTILM